MPPYAPAPASADALPLVWWLREQRRLRAFFRQCKPRVNSLIVFTAMIGMLLASPGLPAPGLFLAATLGIALVAGGAAAINCVLERGLDARMARTRGRPLPRGEIGVAESLTLACATGALGLCVLHLAVNDLTLWLTLATFLGYAVIYTVLLKPATPMNIVIGGASGAMPPLLGWTAMTGSVAPEAWVLFLIVFAWTPPHFWSLACYRRADYARAGLPMLPVTHGVPLTCLHSLLYVVMLSAITLLPYTLGSSGALYLGAAVLLNARFLWHAGRLWRHYSDARAHQAFRYSIFYLTALFAALLADHYLRPLLP